MTPRLAALCLLLAPSAALVLERSALAQERSADIELLRPTSSPASALGVDTPWMEGGGVLRVGLSSAWSLAPLVLDSSGMDSSESGSAASDVVANRLGLHLGLSADLGEVVSARVVMPAAFQWGSDLPELSGDGLSQGDLRAGMRVIPLRGSKLRSGLRADLFLPTGAASAWMGEGQPRISAGLLNGLRLGRWQAALDLGIDARTTQDSGLDLVLSDELVAGLSVGWQLRPDRTLLHAALLSRTGLRAQAQGPGERPVEALVGMQTALGEALGLDLGLGRGLSSGYGTPELRVLMAATWTRRPPPQAPPPLVRVRELPGRPALADEPDPEPEEPVVQIDERPLAQVEQDRVTVRDPIQFARASNRILLESQPTLDALAALLARETGIVHLLIEGHASEEGSHSYNYELSLSRARAVWESLVGRGIAPERLSFRAMGEIRPLQGPAAEGAENRRVELKILIQQPAGTASAEQPPLLIPWTGEAPPLPEPLPGGQP